MLKKLQFGHSTASAVLEDGTVVSWGNASNGALGNNGSSNALTPVYVVDKDGNKIKDIVEISRGDFFGLALAKDRNTLCVGI